MSLAVIGFIVIFFLFVGYTLYGRLISNVFKLDDTKVTPATEINDGVDFIPTKPFYLLGQHFSAIAAAGPIAGPILACQNFGWLPCLLWIVLGVILIGAVHDFSALITSVRHKANSIIEIVKSNLGKTAWICILIFIWIALLYVIIAFTDVTAATFLGKTEELKGVGVINKGGAVAAASIMYLSLAIFMGLTTRFFRTPLWLSTLIFVPATLLVVWIGTQISNIFVFERQIWYVLILSYCFIASLLPLWLLLQPRGYLGGFVLYIALTIGMIGVFFGGYSVQQETFKNWSGVSIEKNLFPFLFVTIACGACSGFHGLVCSGTTSKQIAKESHCKPVGYGGMLLEGFVAFIALATIMILSSTEISQKKPPQIYGEGIAKFLTLLIGEENLIFAYTFGAMAFSTFVFDTIDVAARLGRYILQELFKSRKLLSGIVATALTCGFPLAVLMGSKEGAWRKFWILFGTSNQLLASLTLLTITVWLKNTGRKFWYTLFPTVFIMIITLVSLILHIIEGINLLIKTPQFSTTVINAIIAMILFILTFILLFKAVTIFLKKRASFQIETENG